MTSELPWPLTSGGRLRSFHLLKNLAVYHDVRLVVPLAHERDSDVSSLESVGIAVRKVSVPQRRAWSLASHALGSALRSRPFVMYTRHESVAVRAALAAERDRLPPDVWYFDHLDSFIYADEVRSGLVVGDMHNVYSLLVARSAEEQRTPFVRQSLKREASLLKRI